jgi:hypothetical protein
MSILGHNLNAAQMSASSPRPTHFPSVRLTPLPVVQLQLNWQRWPSSPRPSARPPAGPFTALPEVCPPPRTPIPTLVAAAGAGRGEGLGISE